MIVIGKDSLNGYMIAFSYVMSANTINLHDVRDRDCFNLSKRHTEQGTLSQPSS